MTKVSMVPSVLFKGEHKWVNTLTIKTLFQKKPRTVTRIVEKGRTYQNRNTYAT
jgi:hypothetical protein